MNLDEYSWDNAETISDTIKNLINQADVVLIGIGNELAPYRSIKKASTYENLKLQENTFINFYNIINELVSSKNYFIISSNVDGLIYKSELNKKRIVTPCGNMREYHCSCEDKELLLDEELFYKQVEDYRINNAITCYQRCDSCNQQYIANYYSQDDFCESFYEKQWDFYNKWLTTTLNKNIIIIELGEGFNMPSLIRWPLEKITFINNKARFIRINSTFPQIPENISEKSKAVQFDSKDILKRI